MDTATERVREAQARAAKIRPKVGGFPYLAEVLRLAGVRRNRYLVPGATSLYVTDHGPVVQQGIPLMEGSGPAADWDRDRLVGAIRADQAGHSTFPEFVRGCWEAGVVDFEVDLIARACVYRGLEGQHYVEHYPEVDLSAVGAAA